MNRRSDDYAGDLAAPMRFGIEVVRTIRERLGQDFIVGIRMTGDEMFEVGLDGRAAQEIRLSTRRARARLLQHRGR